MENDMINETIATIRALLAAFVPSHAADAEDRARGIALCDMASRAMEQGDTRGRRHRPVVEATTADGHMLAAASAVLGSDAAVAATIACSRWKLSRVRGGASRLNDRERAAIAAIAAGEPVPPRPV